LLRPFSPFSARKNPPRTSEHDQSTPLDPGERFPGLKNDSESDTPNPNSTENSEENLEDWEDPEALAAQELKRFTRSTENVVCAYLNRWSWNNSIKSRRNLNLKEESETLGSSHSDQEQVLAQDDGSGEGERENTGRNNLDPELDLDTSATPEFHVALIHLCSPFVKCVRVEAGMYFAFERLMTMLGEYSFVLLIILSMNFQIDLTTLTTPLLLRNSSSNLPTPRQTFNFLNPFQNNSSRSLWLF